MRVWADLFKVGNDRFWHEADDPECLHLVVCECFCLNKTTRFRIHLGILSRRKALEDATIEPLALPATLFRTGEERRGAYDYGWGALCKRLTIVGIEGAHLDMLEPQHLDVLRDRIMAALKAATGQGEPRERRSVRRAR